MTLEQLIAFGLTVIAKVTMAIMEASQGKLTPEEALSRISEAAQQDRDVDARVDSAIKQKFPEE